MASNGPRDDFHNQPTQHGDFGVSEQPPTGEIPPPGPPPNPPDWSEQSDGVDPFDQEAEPTPWYRKPAMLIAWLVSVVILIALIVFGIVELLHGETTSHQKTTTSTTPTTTTTTSTTPTTTTTTTSSPGSSAQQPPAQQPTQQPQPTGGQTQQPSHHHHLPQLPPVITVPGVPNPVTVPPGLR